MADEFAEFGGYAVSPKQAQNAPADEFAQFGGKQSNNPAHDHTAFVNLFRRLFFPTLTPPTDVETRGFLTGLKRQDVPDNAGIDEKFAGALGRYAPAFGGTMAAAAAAPVVAPAAAVAAPLLTSAAATGLGAAGGDLASMAGAKALGGNAPDSAKDAVTAAGKTGLEAAAFDLGLGSLAKGLATVAPKLVANLKSFPKEALKRTMERPDEVLSILEGSGKRAQAVSEAKAVDALRQIQTQLTNARTLAGKEVEAGLEELQAATKGAKIVDSANVADAGAEALANRSTSDGVSALSKAEQSKVEATIKELQDAGPLSARDAIVWRRKLDNMIDYKRGAVPEITSGEGQGIIAQMAKQLRAQIGEAADAAGSTRLAQANAKFHDIANTYDAYRPSFNTKTTSSKEAVRRVEALARDFYKGGLTAEDLTGIGQKIPSLQKPMDQLLDSIAAREFTLDGKGSPSGPVMMALRYFAGPDGLATAIQASRGGAGTARRLLGGGAAGLASGANQQ